MVTTTIEMPPENAHQSHDTPVEDVPTATSDIAQTALTSAQVESQVGTQHQTLHDLMESDAQCGIQNYGRLPLAFARGDRARLWDVEGREYLDFLGGIAVVTVGHSHPRVTQAISHQAATLLHTSNIYYIEPQMKLARRLHDLTNGMRAFFCNSGAEANEAALKLARKHASEKGESQRNEIITVEDSFHGRTYGSLAATGQPKYHEGFAPMPGGFRYLPRNDIGALENAVSERTAAIMLEPILGESGVLMCDDEYLHRARQLCDERGALLILDEVQSGNGRTGKFLASEWPDVQADIVTLAKGLGNGVPIGAMLARENVAKSFVPGNHGSTFGGNFLSCAAALATLDVLEDENLMQNAIEVGDYFRDELTRWGNEIGIASEVRGRGLIIGVPLNQPIARDLMKASLEQGLIFNAVGDSILRFLPPLCVTRSDVDEALAKLRAAHASLKQTPVT